MFGESIRPRKLTRPLEPLQKKHQNSRDCLSGDLAKSDIIKFIDRRVREEIM